VRPEIEWSPQKSNSSAKTLVLGVVGADLSFPASEKYLIPEILMSGLLEGGENTFKYQTTVSSKSRLSEKITADAFLTWVLHQGKAAQSAQLHNPSIVPGIANTTLLSKRYAYGRGKISFLLLKSLQSNILDTFVFEDLSLFGAYNSAYDLASSDKRGLQSLQMGVIFGGSLFGANNQSFFVDVARGVETKPVNRFSFGLGRKI
jgi:hypothetical protein